MLEPCLRLALLVGAITLSASASAGAVVRLDRGMAGIELEMSAREVRTVLGPPTRVVPGKWRVGFIARTYVYRQRRLSVDFLLGGGSRLYAYEITTRSVTERTADGVGVASTTREVRQKIPDVACRPEGGFIVCRRPREGGVGGTRFVIRQGRVVRVTVFAPVF